MPTTELLPNLTQTPADNAGAPPVLAPSCPEEPAKHDNAYWFVLRYRNHSRWLKSALQAATGTLQIFHEYKTVRRQRGGRAIEMEQPVLHGYIFVSGAFEEVLDCAQKLNLHLMLNPFIPSSPTQGKMLENPPVYYESEEQRYVRIPDRAMRLFVKAVRVEHEGNVLYDPNDVDVQHDDLVTFVGGDYKGQTGYLKPGRGPQEGLVVMALPADDGSAAADAATNPSAGVLCYAVPANKSELAVVSFGPKNRHAKDCIIYARRIADKAFEQYRKDGSVDSALREKLEEFVGYYGHAQLKTKIQRAQHLVLLYRMYTILNEHASAAETRNRIEQEVIPDLIGLKDAAQKRNNTAAAGKHGKLLDDIHETDKVCRA